jgi:hypothetical protein
MIFNIPYIPHLLMLISHIVQLNYYHENAVHLRLVISIKSVYVNWLDGEYYNGS